MIRQSTVFVLGAGASEPYGFPSGMKLAEEVCHHLEKRNHELGAALRLHCHDAVVAALPVEFRRSGQYSLDAFVERRHEFRDVVKLAIVRSLIPCENDVTLIAPRSSEIVPTPNGPAPRPPDRDWYRYLLTKIITTKAEGFHENQLRVVTFNFDRSFERRLFIGLKANYNLDDAAAATLAESIPVLHLHGDLGEPAWLPHATDRVVNVPRRTYGQPLDPRELRSFASRLALINEEIPGDRLDTARRWLREADVICFLGFGYHPDNLARLGIADLKGMTMRGTAMGIEEGELTAIRGRFHGDASIHFFRTEQPACDIRGFLRHTDFIHG